MDKHTTNAYLPDYIVTPGEILSDELEIRGMTQQELATRTGLTAKHINAILKADSALTPETAIKLERAIGMPASYWINLENNYQETKARINEEKKLEQDLGWLQRVPINTIAKLGWLQKETCKKQQLIDVLNFFGVANVAQWEALWGGKLPVAYRQHPTYEIHPEAVSAWLRKGELEAAKIDTAPFDKTKFRNTLLSIRSLTTERPEIFIPQMTRLCAESGVAVVFVPCLPKTGISGATRWLKKDKAIIQLSLRYKTDDHLWFTFFHEAGHILLHGKKDLFLEGQNGLSNQQEDEANQFSQEMLIRPKDFSLLTQGGKRLNKQQIIDFSKSIGIAPGIVVGQLQHSKHLPQSYYNDLKQRFCWSHEKTN